jgi:hypothetical protein
VSAQVPSVSSLVLTIDKSLVLFLAGHSFMLIKYLKDLVYKL